VEWGKKEKNVKRKGGRRRRRGMNKSAGAYPYGCEIGS
jgi:hypothetical protein